MHHYADKKQCFDACWFFKLISHFWWPNDVYPQKICVRHKCHILQNWVVVDKFFLKLVKQSFEIIFFILCFLVSFGIKNHPSFTDFFEGVNSGAIITFDFLNPCKHFKTVTTKEYHSREKFCYQLFCACGSHVRFAPWRRVVAMCVKLVLYFQFNQKVCCPAFVGFNSREWCGPRVFYSNRLGLDLWYGMFTELLSRQMDELIFTMTGVKDEAIFSVI